MNNLKKSQKPPKEEGMHRWSSDVKKLANLQEREGPQEKTIRMYEIEFL